MSRLCATRSLARQYGQDHIAAEDARCQGFATGCLDRGQSVVEHCTQHFDELAIVVGMRLQLRTDFGQAGRQLPVLERCAVAQGAGLAHQDR